jgi:hypothetical protein
MLHTLHNDIYNSPHNDTNIPDSVYSNGHVTYPDPIFFTYHSQEIHTLSNGISEKLKQTSDIQKVCQGDIPAFTEPRGTTTADKMLLLTYAKCHASVP